eukprot:PhF_6_TR22274/c0_g1_i1/m.31501
MQGWNIGVSNCPVPNLVHGVWSVATRPTSLLVGDALGGVHELGLNFSPASLTLFKSFKPQSHSAAIVGLRVCEIADIAISLDFDAILCVWRLSSHSLLVRHQGPPMELFCIDVHPNGHYIYVGTAAAGVSRFELSSDLRSLSSTPLIWSTTQGVSTPTIVSALRLCEKGEQLAVGHSDGSVSLLDATSGSIVSSVRPTETAPIRHVCVASSNIFTCSVAGTVQIVRPNGEVQVLASGGVNGICFDTARSVLWISSAEDPLLPLSADGQKSSSVVLKTPAIKHHGVPIQYSGGILVWQNIPAVVVFGDNKNSLLSIHEINT